jgi:hypothetical protein
VTPALAQTTERSSVEPEPTDSSDNVMAKFAEQDRLRMTDLHPDYIKAFVKVQTPLIAGDLDAAQAAFVPMTDYRRDHGYAGAEEVYYQLLEYWLAKTSNDATAARRSLEILVATGQTHLDEEFYVPAAMDLLKQQVQDKSYAESLVTYESVQKSDSGREVSKSVSGIMEKVSAVVNGEEPVVIAGELDASGQWTRQMIRRAMFIDAPDGGVTQQVFDCENKRAVVPYTEGSELAIPESWGSCKLTIEGEPGARFEWVQANVPQ